MTSASPTVTLIPTPPQATRSSGLAPIDFHDCYHGHTVRPGVTAMEAARAMFARPPGWVVLLMSARNALVRRLGLKTPDDTPGGDIRRAGIFPVQSEMPNEVVLGFDDRHLDFRVWVSVQPSDGGTAVWSCTLVRLHGWPGRTYLFVIMPFHKLIARHLLARALKDFNEAAR